MTETWIVIEEFPDYMISDLGRVANRAKGKMLSRSIVQNGIPTVGLMLNDRQYRRAVPLLVAKAFLDPPEIENFNTPIHLDGDRSNCRFDNLMWRPRWFAIAYHKEKKLDQSRYGTRIVENVNTGERFASIRECSMFYGLLEVDIYLSLFNKTWVFPEGAYFRHIR